MRISCFVMFKDDAIYFVTWNFRDSLILGQDASGIQTSWIFGEVNTSYTRIAKTKVLFISLIMNL